MDNFEKRKLVEATLLQDAGPSNREIARTLNLSEGLVRVVRDELEKAGRIQAVERDKGGRRPKELSSEAQHQPLNADEERSQLRATVLSLVEEGKLATTVLVEMMSVDQLRSVIQHQTSPERPDAKPITGFKGEYAWLSDSWPAPVKLDDMQFPNVEAAFQAAKTLDPEVRAKIASLPTPEQAKEMGHHIMVRPDWDNVKSSIMQDLLRQKFGNQELRQKLHYAFLDAPLEDTGDGKADNFLGELLRVYELVRED